MSSFWSESQIISLLDDPLHSAERLGSAHTRRNPDVELIERFRAGNRDAFAETYRATAPTDRRIT
jgi:hypothetical protein